MLYRVIGRISLNRDTGSTFRNTRIAAVLEPAGFDNTATGTWETASIELDDAIEALGEVLEDLASLDDPTEVHLDHLWLYIDRVENE